MVPFELFGQAWVLFRGADGRPACVLDECAHRACPLSIGRVVDGQVECPYHVSPGRTPAAAPPRLAARRACGSGAAPAGPAERSAPRPGPHPRPARPRPRPPAPRRAAQGWRFNGRGECTKMPSTVLCRGVAGAPGAWGLARSSLAPTSAPPVGRAPPHRRGAPLRPGASPPSCRPQ